LNRKYRVKVGGRVLEVEVEEVREEVGRPMEQRRAGEIAGPKIVEPALPTAPQIEDAASGVVRAPLPGSVISIRCEEGDHVKAGDPVLTLESMKMENTIFAPKNGIVKRIAVKAGASVRVGEPLIEIT
jgi:biotin carboxyl carrier protein